MESVAPRIAELKEQDCPMPIGDLVDIIFVPFLILQPQHRYVHPGKYAEVGVLVRLHDALLTINDGMKRFLGECYEPFATFGTLLSRQVHGT